MPNVTVWLRLSSVHHHVTYLNSYNDILPLSKNLHTFVITR